MASGNQGEGRIGNDTADADGVCDNPHNLGEQFPFEPVRSSPNVIAFASETASFGSSRNFEIVSQHRLQVLG